MQGEVCEFNIMEPTVAKVVKDITLLLDQSVTPS